MKRIAAFLAFLFAAVPALALADTVEVGNFAHKTLRYEIRCNDGSDSWHRFSLASLEHRNVSSNDWNYDCSGDRYRIRIGTNHQDSDTTWDSMDVRDGQVIALTENTQNLYKVVNAATMVAFINPNNNDVHVGYRCVEGVDSSSEVTIKGKNYGAFWNPSCTRWDVSITVRQDDGSQTQQSRTVTPGNVFLLKWIPERRVYDFVKTTGNNDGGADNDTSGNPPR